MGSFLCVLTIPVVHTALTKSNKAPDNVPSETFNEYCNVNGTGEAQKVQL